MNSFKQRTFIADSKLRLVSELYGGDFAGYLATYSGGDGSLIEIPDYLVPKALIEWGEKPSALEVIVSEEKFGSQLQRQTVQILPAVGCSVDNLDTVKKDEIMEINSFQQGANDPFASFEYDLRNGNKKVEAVFVNGLNRIRIEIEIAMDIHSGFSIRNPINLTFEQKISNISTKGKIADGGGLTASEISRLFVTFESIPKFNVPNTVDIITQQHKRVLSLPGNLKVSTPLDGNQEPWTLEISHSTITGEEQHENHVLQRIYQKAHVKNE